MKYAGETLYMVVNEGEIVDMFADPDEAEGCADSINANNLDDEIEEAGYDPDDLSDTERAGFAFSSGYNNGYAYYEAVTIPDEPEAEDYDEEDDSDDEYFEEVIDEEDTYCTSRGDEFTYAEIIAAMDEAIAREEALENIEEDTDEEYVDEDYEDEDYEL